MPTDHGSAMVYVGLMVIAATMISGTFSYKIGTNTGDSTYLFILYGLYIQSPYNNIRGTDDFSYSIILIIRIGLPVETVKFMFLSISSIN